MEVRVHQLEFIKEKKEVRTMRAFDAGAMVSNRDSCRGVCV
jgi:hypothetical protein